MNEELNTVSFTIEGLDQPDRIDIEQYPQFLILPSDSDEVKAEKERQNKKALLEALQRMDGRSPRVVVTQLLAQQKGRD